MGINSSNLDLRKSRNVVNQNYGSIQVSEFDIDLRSVAMN